MAYRKLTENEIIELKDQGCHADEWDKISVKMDFSTDHIVNVKFKGTIQLGVFNELIEIYPGIEKHSGLYNTSIKDVIIDDNVYISDVKNMANYHVCNNVAIENVNIFLVTAESTFGNGTEIEILNEGGGRELLIFDKLSSQLAYLLVNYHHDAEFIEKLNSVVHEYIRTKKSKQGYIGRSSKILNCSSLENVWIGDNTLLTGALKLFNGTIASVEEDPVFVGDGVSAEHFIIQSGSKIDGCAIISRCFIGQSVQIGKQYSADNSAFFANCEGFHGEACSIFAGPYSVTHHKSTLLIAGMFSFYNAGSGTNQSNHMYKLGPVHQGILERGAKTGSFSYMLWPSRVGAFSAVIGKHYVNFDSSDFPFSYINEDNGKSVLTPAMNLFTVGTKRDSSKWPNRDKRKSNEKLDIINFDFLNPYIINKILNGKSILQSLYESTSKEKEFVQVKGLFIKRLLLKRCSKYYDMALKIFIGDQLIKQIQNLPQTEKFEKFRSKLISDSQANFKKWIDMAGMILPYLFVTKLINEVKKGKINSIEEIYNLLKQVNVDYDKNVWIFTLKLIEKLYDKPLFEMSKDDLIQILNEWEENYIKFNNMIIADASKEFDSISRIGYGIDGDEETVNNDFENVRGTFRDNKFVKELEEESFRTKELALKMNSTIQKLS